MTFAWVKNQLSNSTILLRDIIETNLNVMLLKSPDIVVLFHNFTKIEVVQDRNIFYA